MNEQVYVWGLFCGSVLITRYTDDQYEQALEDLSFEYEENGIRHQLKLL